MQCGVSLQTNRSYIHFQCLFFCFFTNESLRSNKCVEYILFAKEIYLKPVSSTSMFTALWLYCHASLHITATNY